MPDQSAILAMKRIGMSQGELEMLQQRQLDLQLELALEMQKPAHASLVDKSPSHPRLDTLASHGSWPRHLPRPGLKAWHIDRLLEEANVNSSGWRGKLSKDHNIFGHDHQPQQSRNGIFLAKLFS